VLHEQDNEIVKVTSPLDHDITSGNLCIKGRFGFQFVQEREETPPEPGEASGDGAGRT
jgi:predicted molibdopterin-dependent oxidoreductase YjgC